ncbi:MAG: hypothetical protein IPK97_05275 [Ahniella sp.]|nr:hypothetical protein [Ahniella sp.]
MSRRPLFLALIAALSTSHAFAEDTKQPEHHAKKLDAVVVSADPLGQPSHEAAQPIKIIAGAELEDRRASTIGETVANEVGVHSTNLAKFTQRP